MQRCSRQQVMEFSRQLQYKPNPVNQDQDSTSIMSSVTDARAGDICLHIAPLIGQCSIAVGAVEEDPEEDSQEAKVEEDEDEAVPSQLTPPWSRPDQERLHRRHRCRTLPQCPRPLGRETSCAPLWPAMSAGGEVGTPCPP